MSNKYDSLPDEIKKEAAQNKPEQKVVNKYKNKYYQSELINSQKKARKTFKTRGKITLTTTEVKAIKAGRKKLKKELKEKGIYTKDTFEMMASSLGLYFDDRRLPLIIWFKRNWLTSLLALLAFLLLTIFIFALVQKMRGRFTINVDEQMFKEGFSLSETADFNNPTTQLFASSDFEAPCVSINQLPLDLDLIDGQHNDVYYAYTFYIRNDGESIVDYSWTLSINSELLDASEAVWAGVFEDGDLRIYAKPNKLTGEEEAIPAKNDDSKGYIFLPIKDLLYDQNQVEVVKNYKGRDYYRIIPYKYESDNKICSGTQVDVYPTDTHRYTIILWIEGDDPDASDDIIGGHIGIELNFRLTEKRTIEEK